MQKLVEFIQKYSHVLVFIILEIIAILFIVQNSIYQRSRIVKLGNGIAGTWHSGVSTVTSYFGLKAENQLEVEDTIVSQPAVEKTI